MAEIKESRDFLEQADKHKEWIVQNIPLIQRGSNGDLDKHMHPGHREMIEISVLS